MTELTRPVPVKRLVDGTTVAFSYSTPKEMNIRAEVSILPSRVIPVVFVPGIMGSNLKKIGSDDEVWRPPNGTPSSIEFLFKWLRKNAAARQKLFDPNQSEVDNQGPIVLDLDKFPWLDQDEARARGWGEIHWDSYGEFLTYLEEQMNACMVNGKAPAGWRAVIDGLAAREWGAQLNKDPGPLGEEEFERLCRASFPVYACGYNWLASSQDSGHRLAKRITEIIDWWKQGYKCEQVLVVTHSMGGFVARRAAQLIPDKILGVVHGVQPTLGAAAVYKRMRLGFEGISSLILGWDEDDTTASLANAPGPLELLPQPDYNGGRPWLEIDDGPGGAKPTLLPKADPYEEIYLKDAKTTWYGLVNSDRLDPSNLTAGQTHGPWQQYVKRIANVRRFHRTLSEPNGRFHAHTYLHYGADKGQAAWAHVRWQASKHVDDVLVGRAGENPGIRRSVPVIVGDDLMHYEISMQDAAGDATVPADASAQGYLDSPGVQQCFRLSGFEHQFSFNNETARHVTLYSLAMLTQLSPLVSQE